MKYSHLPLNMLQTMLEREIIDIEKTHDVYVESIQFPESVIYRNGDSWCETIYATMKVGEDDKKYEFEWDCDAAEITTVIERK